MRKLRVSHPVIRQTEKTAWGPGWFPGKFSKNRLQPMPAMGWQLQIQ
jgi:hypothetical protein